MSSERSDALPAAIFSTAEHRAWSRMEDEAADRLVELKKKHGIPEIRLDPGGKDILVFRLPAPERRTKGGLHLPSQTYGTEHDGPGRRQRTEDVVVNIGILLDAGCEALDALRAEGYLLGDVVKFSKYGGEEENAHWMTPGGDALDATELKDILQLYTTHLRGSFDRWERLHGAQPTMKKVFAVDGDGNGIYVIKPITKE